MIRHRELDSTAAKIEQFAQKDREVLRAWATGERSFETHPGGDEYLRGVGLDLGPRVIPHDATLTKQDEADIAEGKAVRGLPTIPSNARLTAEQLSDIAAGRATLGPPKVEASAEFARDRAGVLEIPASRLSEAINSRVCSLEDVSAGRVKVIG